MTDNATPPTFAPGDRVRVRDGSSVYHGKAGVVVVPPGTAGCLVRLDTAPNHTRAFLFSQLEPELQEPRGVDEERSGFVRLAFTHDMRLSASRDAICVWRQDGDEARGGQCFELDGEKADALVRALDGSVLDRSTPPVRSRPLAVGDRAAMAPRERP